MAKTDKKQNKDLVMNQSIFEQIKQIDENGNEYWSARNLSKILDYHEFRNFLPVIDKAKIACQSSGQFNNDHFVHYHEMVSIGSNAMRQLDGIKLSRYALFVSSAESRSSRWYSHMGRFSRHLGYAAIH